MSRAPDTECRLCFFMYQDGASQLGAVMNANKSFHTWPFRLRLGGRDWQLTHHGSGGRWSIPTYRQVELAQGEAA